VDQKEDFQGHAGTALALSVLRGALIILISFSFSMERLNKEILTVNFFWTHVKDV
jgi:hypothetical protein